MPKKRSEKQRRATAYHEAGHAVAAYELRRGFRRISIVEDEDSLGSVLYRKWGEKFDPNVTEPGRARKLIEKAIMTALAGAEAEHVHTKRRNNAGGSSDSHSAVTLASYIIDDFEEELPAYIEWLRIRTRNILTTPANWRAVEFLAEALLEKEEMSAAAARKVIVEGRRAWFDEQRAASGLPPLDWNVFQKRQ